MKYDEILAQLVEILTPFAKGRVVVTADTELVGELDLGSLQVMDLTLAVEDRFDIAIPLNALADVKTVDDLARQVQQRLGDAQ
jgi:acyl carrier protein